MKAKVSEVWPAGYAWLLRRFNLPSMPDCHTSSVVTTGSRQRKRKSGHNEDIYPLKYWPGGKVSNHLEFALKYDGINLSYLKLIFDAVVENEIVDYIKSKPTGKYARRIWFFYEFLTGRRLPVEDLVQGNYLELLEPDIYYTLDQGIKSQRHRIINNLLGTRKFCPMVRKTEKLKKMEPLYFQGRCEEIVESYPSYLLKTVLDCLYGKETKASFEIERVKPDTMLTKNFIASLKLAQQREFCDKTSLISLQNLIVDPRFADRDYRKIQNYIGQTISCREQLVHYVCPKPQDIPNLMCGLIASHQLMRSGGVSAVVQAAVVAYGFVFIHPFQDGNGRIHRFLIHNILSVRGAVPEYLMFPVSVAMLSNLESYRNSLEAFSLPLMQLVEYGLDELGHMTVHNDTVSLYRYIDMTAQAEALCGFINQAIENEIPEELSFLANYGSTKRAIQNVIDMPDRLIDLFIRICLENKGRLPANKRKSHFDFLSDDELSSMENVIRENYERLS